MQYALISDIHSNLPALDAVLEDIGRRGVTAIYHLGDLVGYSAGPNEVVARLIERAIPGVSGNYDSTVANDYKHCGCRSENVRQEELSHVSYEWTRKHVTAATKSFLEALPFRIDLRPLGGHVAGPTITLVHATPVNNLVYVTEDRPDAFLSKMAKQAQLEAGDAICFGHTHKPWVRTVDGVTFINTGSVGRPKDGDWRAGYVLLSASEDCIIAEIVRVEYDVERAAREVVEAGLPEEFSEFLRSGGQVSNIQTV
jgi:predicted phosphodiesterase